MTQPLPPLPPRAGADAPDDDDERWFELLAGRNVGDVRPSTRREAAWLRAALLNYPPTAPQGAVPDPVQRVQRLLEKAAAAGVIGPPPAPPAGRWMRLRAWWSQPGASLRRGGLGIAVAGVLATVLLRQAWEPPGEQAVIERGPALQQVFDADPAARRDQLLRALQAAGLDAHPFERLGRLGVDVALPVPLAPAQARALAAQGLRVPAGPALQVELLPPPAAASAGRP